MPIPNKNDILGKGFDADYWSKNRARIAHGSKVGANIKTLRKMCGANGYIPVKYVSTPEDLVKVLEAFKKLRNAIGVASGKAKGKAPDTVKYCSNFLAAISVREEDARNLCKEAQNKAGGMDGKDLKKGKEIHKAIKDHLVTAKDTLKRAKALNLETKNQQKIIADGLKKNPPTTQELKKMRDAANNIAGIYKLWVNFAKICAKIGTEWNLKKIPEQIKPTVAPTLKAIDVEYKQIEAELKKKVQQLEVTKATTDCDIAESRIYAALVRTEGKRAGQIYIGMAKVMGTVNDAMSSLKKDVANKNKSGILKHDLVNAVVNHQKALLAKLTIRQNEVKALRSPAMSTKWPKHVVAHFDKQTKSSLSTITTTRKYLAQCALDLKAIGTELDGMLKDVAMLMEGN
ncbi:MAG: hypothetical protein AAF557_03060 [Pseudomonadota bacterium]